MDKVENKKIREISSLFDEELRTNAKARMLH